MRLARPQRDMHHRMRDVQEERLVAMPFDERQGLLRVRAREEGLVLRHFALDSPVPQQRQRRVVAGIERHERAHVVRVGQPEVIVEAVVVGQEFRLVAQVPFPDHARRVAALLEGFGDGHFVRVDALRIARHQDGVPEAGLQAVAQGIAARQQRGARRRADRMGVEAGQLHPSVRQRVDFRRPVGRRPERADISVAHVVDEHEHEVGAVSWLANGCRRGAPRSRENEGEHWQGEGLAAHGSEHDPTPRGLAASTAPGGAERVRPGLRGRRSGLARPRTDPRRCRSRRSRRWALPRPC